MALYNEITVPVRIVLCGTKNTALNMDCLELAYKTRGSIHTIEDDIFTLSSMHDGDTITVGGMLYKLSGGKFFPLVKQL
jgi:hypothetical protein